MAIDLEVNGNTNHVERKLKKLIKQQYLQKAVQYGEEGVRALAEATPKDTGLTSQSWGYEIETGNGETSIIWTNSHIEKGWANIALLLQYGHGTGTGGYVQGRDYINPAMKPIFDKVPIDIKKEVKEL